jgi:hypothetical protein
VSRETVLLDRVRGWAAAGRLPDLRPWLEDHGLVALLPDLYGEEEARRWARRALSENLLLQMKGAEIIEALQARDVPVVALKGIDLLDRLYRDREQHRRTADVDLLIDERRFDEALEIVEGLGYRHHADEPKAVQRRWGKDVTYLGPHGVPVEMHRELFLDMGFTLTYGELSGGGHLERGRGPAGADRLTLEALAVHLLVHMAAHRFGGDSLRWILAILVLLDRHERELDADRLVHLARQLRGRRAAGASAAAIAGLLPEVDLGPLGALPTMGLRERWALHLVDLEDAALQGPRAWTKRGSVLSRVLLDPSPAATLSFLFRKLQLVRGRRSRRK